MLMFLITFKIIVKTKHVPILYLNIKLNVLWELHLKLYLSTINDLEHFYGKIEISNLQNINRFML